MHLAGIPASRAALLEWYGPRRVAYPWRRTRDPYRVLVSEIMLQQTQAARVVPAYRRFLSRFPSARALARAPRREVIQAWDGLGYNRRAVLLSEAARAVVAEHAGRVPSDPAELRRLPGIGPYTAAAVASIAFGIPVAAVDTNVQRVVARVSAGADGHELRRSEVDAGAQAWLDPGDPGAWNQAVMDLGREVCRPRPLCDRCPVRRWCRFAASDRVPVAARRRGEPFEGSLRQVRGAVVRALRARRSATPTELVAETGADHDRVWQAVDRLAADGLVAIRGSHVLLAE